MTSISTRGDDLRLARGVAVSLLLHAAVLLPASWFPGLFGGLPETRPGEKRFEVSLFAFPGGTSPGEIGRVAPAPVPAEAQMRKARGTGASSSREVPAAVVGPQAAASPAEVAEANPLGPEASSPGTGGEGTPGTAGSGGVGSGSAGSGSGGNGGAVSSSYQPPRLLAGALPIDPKDVESLEVPPEIPVRLRVGEDGRIREIVPEMTSLSPAMLQALRRSAAAMRFAPARLDGKPVEAWFSMSFVHRR